MKKYKMDFFPLTAIEIKLFFISINQYSSDLHFFNIYLYQDALIFFLNVLVIVLVSDNSCMYKYLVLPQLTCLYFFQSFQFFKIFSLHFSTYCELTQLSVVPELQCGQKHERFLVYGILMFLILCRLRVPTRV